MSQPMSGDPTETARRWLTQALHDASEEGYETPEAVTAYLLGDVSSDAGWAVVRADVPHGTELRRWQIIGSPGFECWREVSS